MSVKVIIAGGGTGGHIFPAIAIANAVKEEKPEAKILFAGARGRMEMERVPQAGYEIIGLDIAGFNRSALLKNIALPFKILKSLWQAYRMLRKFKPDVVVGVGGYASFPVLQVAQMTGIPTLIQEQNSYAGKANRFLARRAKTVCVAYPGMEKFFPAEKIVYTGNPVRKIIATHQVNRAEALAYFGLEQHRKVVLVIGGSLGAKSINEAIAAGLDILIENGMQLIWQTGKNYFATAKQHVDGKKEVHVTDFIERMEMAYAAADLVVSRAGALAIAELCVAGKPVIFVPFPFAAEDHQTANAQMLVQQKAGIMIQDSEAQGRLITKLLHLAQDHSLREMLGNNIKQLAVYDADRRIAKEVIRLAGK